MTAYAALLLVLLVSGASYGLGWRHYSKIITEHEYEYLIGTGYFDWCKSDKKEPGAYIMSISISPGPVVITVKHDK